MHEKGVTKSQHMLVPNVRNEDIPAKKLPQHIASFSSCLGALVAGLILGWTSSAGIDGKSLESVYNIEISPTDFSWISSIATLGAAVMCIPTGILCDNVGRKNTILAMIVPLTICWLFIIFANSVLMFYVGRFMGGISVGAFCVALPIYTTEIAEDKIRGSLGSYFQLLFAVGILLSYIIGSFVNMYTLSIISAITPFIFFGTFIFMPESPIHYLQKGDEDSARKSLIKLRGDKYNVEGELRKQRKILEENAKIKKSFFVSIKSKATIKGFIISYGLMFFLQFCGINAIIFYVGIILKETGSTLNASNSSIIVGVMQVVTVVASALVVDRVGKRILLLLSAVFMCLSTAALGVYFYLVENGKDVDAINWLPLASVCVFIIAYNVGFGPIAWVMLGELFVPEVKGVAASSAAVLSWLFAFIITKCYDDVKEAIHTGPTYWILSAISAVGTLFVYFVVPETKGKSSIEIQRELNSS
nr:PREDICTED: facilitated trehalose transporter Tret1-like [Megachile rotundata]